MDLSWLPLYEMLIVMLAFPVGYALRLVRERLKAESVTREAWRLKELAKQEVDTARREGKMQAKDAYHKMREKFEEDTRQQRQQLRAQEERLTQREAALDRKQDHIEARAEAVEERLNEVDRRRAALEEEQQTLNTLIAQQRQRIEDVAGLSQEAARAELMQALSEELQSESGARIRRVQEETQLQAEREARRIISIAIERYAAAQVNEITTSTVSLPNDEMKGRIIGKEGRNIKAIESATGINVLIDDTPEVVVLSGFDPVRREVARLALERLIADGRINPALIEEQVAQVQTEMEETIRAAGEAAIVALDLRNVAPDIVRQLGRLKFRHSYAQNVLTHSIEVGHLMGMMAAELGLDVELARRIGLFHDIGKGLDQEQKGSHALLGAEFLKRHGESEILCNAVAAHHGEVPGDSPYAPLTTAADAMTASRPGARSETTDLYIKRLADLEAIAGSFRGVQKAYAIQAGREVRVLIEPSKIDDNEAMQLARNISMKIEQDVQYPGQIKITVIRETRCVEYAR
jgi:ribonuclease Y